MKTTFPSKKIPGLAHAFAVGAMGFFAALIFASSALGAFGLATATDFYTVDTGGGLVFKIRRTDNGVSTQSAGDIMSMVYNGVEYQDQSRGSQLNSGFDYLYNGVSAVTVNAAVVNSNFIRVTVVAGNATHYYIARNGYPHIYMATYFTSEPDTLGLCRYIVRIPASVLPNGPTPSDIRNTDSTIESGDIFGFSAAYADVSLRGQTRSKHYSNMRLKDWSFIGATGASVGVWMIRSNHEGDSGGPFYRSLLNQCGSDQEITYILNYGEVQTEAYRTSILNGIYTLAFTNGTTPAAIDTASWVGGLGLVGYVAPAGRGAVTCPGLTGRDTNHRYTVGFANSTAQYWTDAADSNGSFTRTDMLPGTYTMRVYKNELAVLTASVDVTAGGTNTLSALAITADPSTTVPLWRIGNWDGTPAEFLNGDKITTMHPSDSRMGGWASGTYVVGTSSPATGMPCYQWKDVAGGGQTIQFNLTAAQLVASTVKVGITCAFAGGRPNISVNSWTSALQGASTQPDSRSLTVGSYRGNNVTYSFSVPASALVAGANTLRVYPISGSSGTTYLSPGYSLDCVEISQGTAQVLALPDAPASLDAAVVFDSSVALSWTASNRAASYIVRRASSSGGPFSVVATGVTGTSFTDTGVPFGPSYYTVSASNGSGAGLPSPEASAVVTAELQAYLPFNETGGTVAADASGYGRNGVLVNGPVWAAGQTGNAVDLDGADDYVALPEGVVSGLNDFTIAAWVNPDTLSTWARLFDFGAGTGKYMFLSPSGTGGNLRFAITTSGTGGEQAVTGPALAAGVWTHVAVTLSGTTGILYVNGVAVATNNAMTLKPSSLGSTTQNWIGRSQWPDPYLNGRVDDFRIYARALDAGEIGRLRGASAPAAPGGLIARAGQGQVTLAWPLALGATSYRVKRATADGGPYTTVASPVAAGFTDPAAVNGTAYYYVVSAVNAAGESANSVQAAATPNDLSGWWRFDEKSGVIAADSSGNGNTATLSSSATWAAGRINNAVSLNGTATSYASLPAGVVGALNDFSIATWVYVRTNGSWARLFDFGSGATAYMFLSPASGSNTVRYAITTSGGSGEQQINSPAVLSPGAWHHLVVTLIGSTGTLYIDGVAAGTNANMTLRPSSLGSTSQNYIGKSQFSDPYLNGLVDDFRIYQRGLSASEVSTLGVPPSPPSGLSATPGDAQVSLAWSAVSGATGYNVKRSAVAGGPYLKSGNPTSADFVDTSLANGATYYYVVTTQTGVAESANSAEISVRPTAPVSPRERENVSVALSGGNDVVFVSFSVVGHSYQMQYRDDLQAGAWQNYGAVQAGTGGSLSFGIPSNTAVPRRFYRVVIQP